MLTLDRKLIEQLLFDPVMAAEVLMGWHLDTFQRVRLRQYWYIPQLVDSSGVSSGKTAVNFVYVNLRCMLLPRHVAGVYLPNFQVGKDEFWQMFYDTMDRSAMFRSQLVTNRGVLGEKKSPGTWSMHYKNGSRLLLPAPGFMADSKYSASRNFNTLMIDEWLRALEMGDGVEKQLVDRARRANWNKRHRIWGNHLKFLGHAETPSHKGHRRMIQYKRAIVDGSAWHGLISYCYKDWTPEMAEKHMQDEIIAERKRVLTRDQFRRQWLGLWSSDGDGYYPEVFLRRCCRMDLKPQVARERPEDFYFFGFDTAPGKGVKSDYSAISVLRARQVATRGEATMEFGGAYWHVAFVYSHAMRGRSAKQLTSWFYQLHHAFGFVRGCMDPGGGGTWVYGEMQDPPPLVIEGKADTLEVTPVCDRNDPLQMQKQSIVIWYKRGSELDTIIAPAYRTGDDGLLDASHRMYQEAWVGEQVLIPADIDSRPPAETAQWTPQEIAAGKGLERMRTEMQNIRVKVDKDGTKLNSRKGFTMFESARKKDAAYTGLYAYMSFRVWLAENWMDGEGMGDGLVACG